MKIPNDRPECCPQFLAPCPRDCSCFCREVSREYNALKRRHRRIFIKNRRIMELAKPLLRTEKVISKCPCLIKREIEIVRLDQHAPTRTEQLALPSPRKLLLFKKQVKNTFPANRMYLFNRLIRKSLLSLYSHLSNIQPPEKPIPKVKWTKKEWRQHSRKLEELAYPKLEILPPKIKRSSKPLEEMKRYKKLAQPKRHEPEWSNIWKFTPAMKTYKASDRIKEISVPKKYDEDLLFQTLPIRPPESALKYKPSERIKAIAEPIIKKSGGDNDLKENPFGISPNALKAKASKRTLELAEPKEFENVHIRENPQAISPAALKAKASPRTIELAKPKGS